MLSLSSRNRWTAALRSGEYQQIHGSYRKRDEDGGIGYCALGVLVALEGYKNSNELKAALGADECSMIIIMNDKMGYDFNHIARWIEENVPYYEKVEPPRTNEPRIDAAFLGLLKDLESYSMAHQFKQGALHIA